MLKYSFYASTDNGETWGKRSDYLFEGRPYENNHYYMTAKALDDGRFISGKVGDYYFMHGRSGNWGDEPRCLVLYASKDGINWDRGMFHNKKQQTMDSYTANEIIGKYDPSIPNRLLIQKKQKTH